VSVATKRLDSSGLALISANLGIALFCALRGWGYYETVLVYWLEALVIGAFNVLRLLVVGLAGERPLGSWLAEHVSATLGARIFFTVVGTGFFVLKFGGFALGVGLFALALPAAFAPEESAGAAVFGGFTAAAPGVFTAAGLLVASHGFSFVRNFVARREYARLSIVSLVFLPYARMALVALILVIGFVIAWAAPGAAGSTAFAVAMVLVKTGADVASHSAEHRWMGEQAGREGAPAVPSTVPRASGAYR
jgi:hypothetical protein